MTALQIFIAMFGVAGLVVTVWAIWLIVKAPDFTKKPLWIFGSLLGFVGFTINWTLPERLYFWFGVHIPIVRIFTPIGSGQWFVNVWFPVIALVAVVKLQSRKAEGMHIETADLPPSEIAEEHT